MPQALLADRFALKFHRETREQYDYRLTWAPDLATDSTGPSIFTALEEQLGLRLDSAKGPVAVIVIESAEKPSAN